MEIRPPTVSTMSPSDARIWDVAEKLEASFLTEMLKSAGLGEVKSEFSGGMGEEQFSSFLREAQATEITKTGGLGLAETFFHALKEQENGK